MSCNRPLYGPDQVAVGPREAQGIHAFGLEQGHHLLVGFAGVEHGHDVEGGGVGDAAALHHLGGNAQGLEHLAGPFAAAMNQDFRPRHPGQLGQKAAQLGHVVEDAPTNLEYFQVCAHEPEAK